MELFFEKFTNVRNSVRKFKPEKNKLLLLKEIKSFDFRTTKEFSKKDILTMSLFFSEKMLQLNPEMGLSAFGFTTEDWVPNKPHEPVSRKNVIEIPCFVRTKIDIENFQMCQVCNMHTDSIFEMENRNSIIGLKCPKQGLIIFDIFPNEDGTFFKCPNNYLIRSNMDMHSEQLDVSNENLFWCGNFINYLSYCYMEWIDTQKFQIKIGEKSYSSKDFVKNMFFAQNRLAIKKGFLHSKNKMIDEFLNSFSKDENGNFLKEDIPWIENAESLKQFTN